MHGGRHERKNLLSDKPTHTPTQSSTPTIRRNILGKNPHPLFHALSPHHPPIKCLPPTSLILSSQPPPLPRSSPPLFHTSLLLLTVYTFFKISVKSSRLTVFGYLQIWVDGGFWGSWIGSWCFEGGDLMGLVGGCAWGCGEGRGRGRAF